MFWYVTLIFTNTVNNFFTKVQFVFSWLADFTCVFLCILGCQRDTYKAKIGNTPCLPCPLNSESAPQAVRCECKMGFYRFSGNKYTDICHGKDLVRKSYEECDHISNQTETISPHLRAKILISAALIHTMRCLIKALSDYLE